MRSFLELYKESLLIKSNLRLIDSVGRAVTAEEYVLTELFDTSDYHWGSDYDQLTNHQFGKTVYGHVAGSFIDNVVLVVGLDDTTAIFFVVARDKYQRYDSWGALLKSGDASLNRFRGFNARAELKVFGAVISIIVEYLRRYKNDSLSFAAAYKELVPLYSNGVNNRSVQKRFNEIGYEIIDTGVKSVDHYGNVFRIQKL